MHHGADDGAEGPATSVPEFQRMRSSPVPPSGSTSRPRTPGSYSLRLPSRRARRRHASVVLAGMMSIVVLLASGTAWALTSWVSGQMRRYDVFAGLTEEGRPSAGPRGTLNVLLIGSDSRDGLSSAQRSELGVGHVGGGRSDTMMLVHLNESHDHLTVVGIPRDSWVPVAGHGLDKINAAYAYGGPQLAVRTVENTTGVRIDHYIEIDFGGFVDVINALGGIEVCLEQPIHDEKAKLNMARGTHSVDGATALAFARTRKSAGGDLDRIDRQHQVMSALLDKALSSDTLRTPEKFTDFLDTALGSITVDKGLTTSTISQLGNQLRAIDLNDVTFTQVPVAQVDYWTPRGDVAIKWDEPAAARMFDRIANDEPVGAQPKDDVDAAKTAEPLERGDIAVRVFNGVGTPGLAGRVSGELAAAGFTIAAQARNWSTHDVSQTVIRHAPEQAKAARMVSAAVPGARLEVDASLNERIQVVLGADFSRVVAPQPSSELDSAPSAAAGGGTVQTSTARQKVCP
ncbi:LCP family protein [Salinactinospora qingdaonensis]|uniref:LCP family protein n=1 Tax=Salinactinospora qingdaonensis TaxID=702744 RepID=A0ABP7FX51_9ACTN